MFFALMFRSLQLEDLLFWLPKDCGIQDPEQALGLNVALPLHQSWVEESKRSLWKLF
ncbi:hypothetical protein F4680DRAFT_422367, partial [Xylaria scruposa]